MFSLLKTYRISSQSSLSFKARLASDTWDTLTITILAVTQTAGGQSSTV